MQVVVGKIRSENESGVLNQVSNTTSAACDLTTAPLLLYCTMTWHLAQMIINGQGREVVDRVLFYATSDIGIVVD